MSAHAVPNYSDTCSRLAQEIQNLNVNIRVSEQSMKLKEKYESELTKMEANIALCNGVIEKLKPLVADIRDYINRRYKECMQSINNALRLAGEIIPDAGSGVHFETDGEDAWLATQDGLEVQMVEGGGFRQVSSAFLRSVVLGANPDNLQTLLLDEVFSLVSQTNSSTLSLYLNVLTQDFQIISIEQKPQVYSNIDCVMYTFTKDNEYSEVKRTEVKRNSDASA